MRKILRPEPVQRAARRPETDTPTDPRRVTLAPGKVATLPMKALYRMTEAMQLLSYGRTEIYNQIRQGRLRTVGEGRMRRVPAGAISDHVALLEAEAAGRAPAREAEAA